MDWQFLRRKFCIKAIKLCMTEAGQDKVWKKWAAAWQNQQNDLCAQRRLGSALASALSDAQADQSSLGAQDILLVLSWGGSNTFCIMCVCCELKIPSLRRIVWPHLASLLMPKSYPHDRIFNFHLTSIKYFYKLGHIWPLWLCKGAVFDYDIFPDKPPN